MIEEKDLITAYKKQLKTSVDFICKIEKYEKIAKKFDEIKAVLSSLLEMAGGKVSTAVEDYLNVERDLFIPPNVNLCEPYKSSLIQGFEKLNQLYERKIELGWKSEERKWIDTILTLCPTREMERDIKKKFGKKEGERIIFQAKKEICSYEKEINVTVFTEEYLKWQKERNRLDEMLVLFAKTPIVLTAENNVNEESVEFVNYNGESLIFNKTAQIDLNGERYISLSLDVEKDGSKEREYYLYKVQNTANGYYFLMEENDDIIDEIFAKEERLTTDFLIEYNKNKKA